MKALNTVLSVVLLIAVAFLFWKVYDTPTRESKKTPDSKEIEQRLENKEFAAAHIAFINTDSLVKNYDYHKELKAELEEKAKRLEADLSNKSKVFEENLSLLQQQAQGMSQEELQSAQMDLERTRDGLLRYRDEQANQLALQEQQLNKRIKEDMESVLTNIKEEYNLDFILSFDPNSILLSTNEDYDITPLVVERLNQKYSSSKSEKEKTKKDK
ncbi:MAG: OmpH family outer membrane protein [Owenweeksia sp.]